MTISSPDDNNSPTVADNTSDRVTLVYRSTCKTDKRKLWNVLTSDASYRQWAKAFSDNSHFVGDWVQGQYIKFIDPDMGGTRARLECILIDEEIVIRHNAVIAVDGTIATTGDMADKWVGTLETYRIEQDGDSTMLTITIETDAEFKDMFDSSWPSALNTICKLCEC